MPIIFPDYETLSRLPISKSRLDRWLDWTSERFDDVLNTRPPGFDATIYADPPPGAPPPGYGAGPGPYPARAGTRPPPGYVIRGGSYQGCPPILPGPNGAPPRPFGAQYREGLPRRPEAYRATSRGPATNEFRPDRDDRRASMPAAQGFQHPPANGKVPPPPKSILKGSRRGSRLNTASRSALTPPPSYDSADSPELKPANLQRVHPMNPPLSPSLSPASVGGMPNVASDSSTQTLKPTPSLPLRPGLRPTQSAKADPRLSPNAPRVNPYIPSGLRRESYGTRPKDDAMGSNAAVRPRANTADGAPVTHPPVPMPQMAPIDPMFGIRVTGDPPPMQPPRPVQAKQPPPQDPLKAGSGATEEEQWRARREAQARRMSANPPMGLNTSAKGRAATTAFPPRGSNVRQGSLDRLRGSLREEKSRRDRRGDAGRRGRRYEDSDSSGSESDSESSRNGGRGKAAQRNRRRRVSVKG